jgi:hypothetical protein
MRVLGTQYFQHYTPWSYAYLKKEASRDDIEINADELIVVTNTGILKSDVSKYYLA